MTLLVRAPDTWPAERRYVLDVVLTEWLGLDYDLAPWDRDAVAISLAGDPGGMVLTLPDVLFATARSDWLRPTSLPERPLWRREPGGSPGGNATWWHGAAASHSGASSGAGALPVLYGAPPAGGARAANAHPADARAGGGSAYLDVDVFGGVFFLLTRYEELAVPAADAHGRTPAAASIASAEAFLERALADEYTDLLWDAISRCWPQLERRTQAFRISLTHDVDQPWSAYHQPASRILQRLAGDVVRRRDLRFMARRLRAIADARRGRVDRDPLNTFDFLMRTSERHGLRSTFYFLTGPDPGEEDFRYRITDPPFGRLLKEMHARGHEIGLHASYLSHGSADRTRTEFERLSAACEANGVHQESYGVRQHYLRFAVPTTWRNQDAAGLAHDSTVGFADAAGFRAGTSRSFPVFDLVAGRPLRLRERPLIAMDGTLLEYMGLAPGAAAAHAVRLAETARSHGGEFVLLYHNNTLMTGAMQAHYRELVESLAALR